MATSGCANHTYMSLPYSPDYIPCCKDIVHCKMILSGILLRNNINKSDYISNNLSCAWIILPAIEE
jgi:hypothetical protein